MQTNDLSQKYSKGIIIIHWLSTLLIFGLFFLGLALSNLETSQKLDLLKPHASLGFLLFLITIVRSILFFKSPRPDDLKTGSKFNDKLAIWIHNAFYNSTTAYWYEWYCDNDSRRLWRCTGGK